MTHDLILLGIGILIGASPIIGAFVFGMLMLLRGIDKAFRE